MCGGGDGVVGSVAEIAVGACALEVFVELFEAPLAEGGEGGVVFCFEVGYEGVFGV